MRYDVHIFAVVRVKISDVKARSHADAVRKAEAHVDLYRLFDAASIAGHASEFGASETEYADEVSSRLAYLVDQAGAKSYSQSRRFDEDHEEIPESLDLS
ncbi:MAG: hypothetical protein ACRD3O_01710 [Terriglobia bacterium]